MNIIGYIALALGTIQVIVTIFWAFAAEYEKSRACETIMVLYWILVVLVFK